MQLLALSTALAVAGAEAVAAQEAELLVDAQAVGELTGEAEPVPPWEGLTEELPLSDRAAVAEGVKD